MSDQRIRTLGTTYHEWVRTHPGVAEIVSDEIEELLTDAGVTYDRVTARVKTWPSLKAKASKRSDDGSFVYDDPWADIHDIVGVRITVFHSTEIPVALAVMEDAFVVLRAVDKTAETRISGGFGYGSYHLVVEVPEDPEADGLEPFVGMCFEVQVRTVLQHAWAEFEHDIRYKNSELDPRVDRAFTLAAGLIELADQQFDQIAALNEPPQRDTEDIEISAETLPGILAMLVGTRFPRSRSDNYRWLEELLTANGVTTVSELDELLDDEDIATLEQALRYRFQPSQVRLIDDLLLLRYQEAHIERTGTTGTHAGQRPRRLGARLKAMRQYGVPGTSPSHDDPSSSGGPRRDRG